jgi:hypothetical protein
MGSWRPQDDPPRERPRHAPGPVPTIGQLMRQKMGNWAWFWCRNPACGHYRAMALAPIAIKLGLDMQPVPNHSGASSEARGFFQQCRLLLWHHDRPAHFVTRSGLPGLRPRNSKHGKLEARQVCRDETSIRFECVPRRLSLPHLSFLFRSNAQNYDLISESPVLYRVLRAIEPRCSDSGGCGNNKHEIVKSPLDVYVTRARCY